jgi:hypothetical protein
MFSRLLSPSVTCTFTLPGVGIRASVPRPKGTATNRIGLTQLLPIRHSRVLWLWARSHTMTNSSLTLKSDQEQVEIFHVSITRLGIRLCFKTVEEKSNVVWRYSNQWDLTESFHLTVESSRGLRCVRVDPPEYEVASSNPVQRITSLLRSFVVTVVKYRVQCEDSGSIPGARK